MTSDVPLIASPSILRDPAWEMATLGPSVRLARRLLARQLRDGICDDDVRPMLRLAYERVPHYQKLFAERAIGLRDLEGPRALRHVPPTTRAMLRAGIEPFLAHPIEPFALERGWLGRTSGSTGEPVPYLRDPRTVAWFQAFLDFALAYAGRPKLRRGARIALLDAIAHRPAYDAKMPLLHDATLVKRSFDPDDDEAIARLLHEHTPTIVSGDPLSLAPLARISLPKRGRPALVVSSAFAMPSALRAAIEANTGATVIEYYAAQETSLIGIACKYGRGFHAVAGASYVESIEVDGASEIAVTPLSNPTFVLIRYLPGDLGEVVRDRRACRCGLRGARVVRLDGRTDVRFVGDDGASFAPGLLNPLLGQLDVDAHQLVQHDATHFTLRTQSRRPIERAPIESIERRLAALVGAPIVLTLESVARLHPRGEKPKPFIRAQSAVATSSSPPTPS